MNLNRPHAWELRAAKLNKTPPSPPVLVLPTDWMLARVKDGGPANEEYQSWNAAAQAPRSASRGADDLRHTTPDAAAPTSIYKLIGGYRAGEHPYNEAKAALAGLSPSVPALAQWVNTRSRGYLYGMVQGGMPFLWSHDDPRWTPCTGGPEMFQTDSWAPVEYIPPDAQWRSKSSRNVFGKVEDGIVCVISTNQNPISWQVFPNQPANMFEAKPHHWERINHAAPKGE